MKIYESAAMAKTTPSPPMGRGTQTEYTAETLVTIAAIIIIKELSAQIIMIIGRPTVPPASSTLATAP